MKKEIIIKTIGFSVLLILIAVLGVLVAGNRKVVVESDTVNNSVILENIEEQEVEEVSASSNREEEEQEIEEISASSNREKEGKGVKNILADDCLTNINVQSGETVSFPLEVTGEINYDCWEVSDNRAVGYAFIRQNFETISYTGPDQGLIQLLEKHDQEADYPVKWSATISGFFVATSGAAELVITENGPLDPRVIISINIIVEGPPSVNLQDTPPSKIFTQEELEIIVQNSNLGMCPSKYCIEREIKLGVYSKEHNAYELAVFSRWEGTGRNGIDKIMSLGFLTQQKIQDEDLWVYSPFFTNWKCLPGQGHQEYTRGDCLYE